MTKTIVITGASRGLGEQACRRFVEKGWTAIGLARNERELARVRADLGEAFEYHALDVLRHDDVARVFTAIQQRHERIDVLVNNAAVFKLAPFQECTPTDIDAIIDTNLKGTMSCTLRALPVLRQPGGRIINIASVAATHGIKDQAIYCASKFGVDGFAEALGQELRELGVGVTTICPGGIDTPLWNETTNPYPGDLGAALRSGDVVQLIEHVAELSPRVVVKKIVAFPSNEWH